MTRLIKLERRLIPEKFPGFILTFYGMEWKCRKRYTTVDRAIQAYVGFQKTSWNRDFEWRLNTPVGIVKLPVVKT